MKKYLEVTFVGVAALLLGALVAADASPPPLPAPAPLQFPPEFGDHLVVVLDAHDGDTVTFAWLVQDHGRLYGINAPELSKPTAKEGAASRDYLKSLLTGKPMRAKVRGREKYGRSLIELFDAEGRSLSEIMVEKGFAKPWDGKGVRP